MALLSSASLLFSCVLFQAPIASTNHAIMLSLPIQTLDEIAFLDSNERPLTAADTPRSRHLYCSYLQAHGMIRNITGFGVGNGPYIIIHDGFAGLAYWADFLPGSDRIALDTHPYFSFDGQPNTAPLDVDDGTGEPGGVWPLQACNAFGPPMNVSQTAFGVSIAGEFSSAINDCGLYVLGIGNAATYPGNCTTFTDWQNWNSTFKEGLLDYTLASMDSLQNWFFWTWKIGNSSTSGTVEAPVWSYQLGLQNGWLPTDPRVATGKCRALGGTQELFAGTYSAWQTGGPGAGTIAPIETVSFPWPPTTLNDVEGAIYAALPTYTPTGTIPTLPPPQLTPSVSQENGWYDAQDTAGVMTPISGCTYPNAWDSVGVVAPTVPCPARALPVVPTVPTVLVPTVLTTPTPIPVTPIITTTIPPTIVTPAPVAPIA
jgi:glucan 1,3-beta-glucosidase